MRVGSRITGGRGLVEAGSIMSKESVGRRTTGGIEERERVRESQTAGTIFLGSMTIIRKVKIKKGGPLEGMDLGDQALIYKK
jgi:hypothetical protein